MHAFYVISRWVALGVVLLSSCYLSAQSETFGYMQPVTVEGDTTIVVLRDHFLEPGIVTEADAGAAFKCKLNTTKDTLRLIRTGIPMPALSTLNISTRTAEHTLLLKRTRKEDIVFTFDPGDKIYQQVSVVGDLTNWNPNVLFMQNINGVWQTTLTLNPGRYQYQIVADGNWFLDPNNPVQVENGIGGYNSLLEVGARNNTPLPYITPAWLDSASYNGNTYRSVNLRFNFDHRQAEVITLWENTRVQVDTGWRLNEETLTEHPHWQIIIPQEAANAGRTHLRIYAVVNGRYTNDLLIPIENGRVVTDAETLKRDDFQRSIMYFLMVDRFNNGNKKNDQPVKDNRVAPQANYMGGDLAGIQQKLEEGYFEQLGVNALWISPVFQNPMGAYQEFPEPHRWFSGYHGYWPISLSKVDVRFGSNTEFKTLVEDMHAQNMNVFLDYVANHIHAEHPLWAAHPEWFSPLDLPDGRKNLRLWDEQRLTTWFEPYMPSFDHAQPQVAEACADSAMYWLTTFGIDGFRHDATKHIETEFWRLLTYKIKTEVSVPQNKPIYQIGETFGSRELIGSYLGSGFLDAQFDFNMYFDARSVFATADLPFSRLSASLHETFDYYGWHHVMGNLTGNHDMARFISYASGDLKWDENDKEAGWNRKIEVTDPVGYARLKMLHAFNMTVPGIPIIYYGDEIGMPGANDPDNRRMMRFKELSPQELSVQQTVQQLTRLRSTHMALLYGDLIETPVSNGSALDYAYLRNYFNDHVLTVFHKGSSPMELRITLPETLSNLEPKAQFGSTVSVENGVLTVSKAEGNCFEIITFDAR